MAKAQESESPSYDKFVGGYLSITGGKSAAPRYFFNDRFLLSGNGKGVSIYLSPTFGKRINPTMLIGVSPFFAFSKNTELDISLKEYTSKGTEYGLGIFLRKSMKTFGSLNFLLEPSVSWRGGFFDRNAIGLPNNYASKYNQFDIKIAPMLSYNVSSRFRCISKIGSLGYTYDTATTKGASAWFDPEPSSYFNFDFGIRNIYFGIEFLF